MKILFCLILLSLLSCIKEEQIPVYCWRCSIVSDPVGTAVPVIMNYCDVTEAYIRVLEKDFIYESVTENGYYAVVYKTKCEKYLKTE